MSEFRRMITYLYLYEQGVKNRNIGFAKVEKREQRCLLEIHMKNTGYSLCPVPVYFYLQRQDKLVGIPLGNFGLTRGSGEFKTVLDAENLKDSQYTLDDVKGIYIPLTERTMMVSQWDDDEFRREKFVDIKDLPDAADQAAGKQEVHQEPRKASEDSLEGKESMASQEPRQRAMNPNLARPVNASRNQPFQARGINPMRQIKAASVLAANPLQHRNSNTPKKMAVQESVPPVSQTDPSVQAPVPVAQVNASTQEFRTVSQETQAAQVSNAALQENQAAQVSNAALQENQETQASDAASQINPADQTSDAASQLDPTDQASGAAMPIEPLAQASAPGDKIDITVLQESGSFQHGNTAAGQTQASNPAPQTNNHLQSEATNLSQQMRPAGKKQLQDTNAKQRADTMDKLKKPLEDRVSADESADSLNSEEPGITCPSAASPPKAMDALKALEALPRQEYRTGGFCSISGSASSANTKKRSSQKAEMEHTNADTPEDWSLRWRFILENYPVMTPFSGDEDTLCVRLELKDLRQLPRQFWYLGNNSFLLHGFFNYRYLILGMTQENGIKKWFIGIPGVFQNPERVMAALFGFPEFRREKPSPINTGEFGYWYRYLNELFQPSGEGPS